LASDRPFGVLWDKKISLFEKEGIADVPTVIEHEFGFGQRGRHCGKALEADGVVGTVFIVSMRVRQEQRGHLAASFPGSLKRRLMWAECLSDYIASLIIRGWD
jgi:hypothetical protein